MSWDGSGSFTRVYGSTGWVDDRNASTYILATRHDTHDQDLADGINLCITKDGQSKPAASLTPNLDNAYNLGSSALTWQSLFCKVVRFVNNSTSITLSPPTLTVPRNVILPDLDGVISIGSGVVKAADTSLSLVTTLTDDAELTISLSATSKYSIEAYLQFSDNWTAGTHPGIVYRLGYTGTITKYSATTFAFINSAWVGKAPWTSITDQFSQSVLTGGNLPEFGSIQGGIVTNTSGNLTLKFCQFNSAGTTTLKAGSYLKVTKLG